MIEQLSRKANRVLVWSCLFLASIGLLNSNLAWAQQPKPTTALSIVPEDTSVYLGALRIKEQLAVVTESNAWKKLTALKMCQVFKEEFQKKWAEDGDAAEMRAFMDSDEFQKYSGLLLDACSHEVFFTADRTWADLQKLNRLVSLAQYNGLLKIMIQAQQGALDPENTTEELANQEIFQALAAHSDLMRMPTAMFGFRVTDPKAVDQALPEIYALIKEKMEESGEETEILGRYEKVVIEGNSFHTFTLKLKDQPSIQKEMERNENPQTPAMKKLLERVLEMEMTFSIGLHGDYLLLSMGPSTKHLQSLGKGRTLIQHDHLKPLLAHQNRRLTMVTYISQEMQDAARYHKEEFQPLVKTITESPPYQSLPDSLRKRIETDVEELTNDVAAVIPLPGAALGFSVMTETGSEFFSYNHSTNLFLDSSKPLTLLNHVGGTPYMASVWRSKNLHLYESFVKWYKRLNVYGEEFALPALDDEKRAEYDKSMEEILPIAKRFDNITRTMLLPSFADCQSGFMLGSGTKLELPLGNLAPISVVEPGILVGVSDANLLEKAFDEYLTLFKDVYQTARKLRPEELPPFEFPQPNIRETEHGKVISFPIPIPNSGLADDDVGVFFGLGKEVGAFAFSKTQINKLLAPQPLQASAPLSKPLAPSAAAIVLNWGKLMDDYSPYLEFGIRLAAQQIAAEANNPNNEDLGDAEKFKLTPEETFEHLHVLLELAKTFRSLTSRTYQDGDTWITHSVSEWKDIPGKN